MTSPDVPLSAAASGISAAAGRPAADAGKKVLRFSDGANGFADPDLYFPRGLGARLTGDSDLSNAVTASFTMSVATAMTTAAAKSAAQSRAT
jgi:hypothetical protein